MKGTLISGVKHGEMRRVPDFIRLFVLMNGYILNTKIHYFVVHTHTGYHYLVKITRSLSGERRIRLTDRLSIVS